MTEKSFVGAAEAERQIVAALMVQASIEHNVSDRIAGLTPAEFRTPRLRVIFSAELDLLQDGILPTRFEIEQRLRRLGKLDDAGGSQYLSDLDALMPDSPQLERYVAAVVEASNVREQVRIYRHALEELEHRPDSIGVASNVQLAISKFGVREDRSSVGVYDIVRNVHAAADQRASEGRPLGILTGFPELDEMTGGLPRKALSIIAAPTSHGKTAFALNIAQNAVEVRSDITVALYSLEMSRQAISDRITARRAGIPLWRVRDWKCLNEFERDAAVTARESLIAFNSKLFLADRISSIADLIADARKRKATSGLDLAIVDYLQLVAGIDEDNRERTVNAIAWSLFEMAKDLDCAVLALSQVTPAAAHRPSGRLSIDDLRDSKAIGHHSRIVMMLNRPRQSRKEDESIPKCRTFLQVEKNSEGETGDVEFHFDGPQQEFTQGGCGPRCAYWARGSAAA